MTPKIPNYGRSYVIAKCRNCGKKKKFFEEDVLHTQGYPFCDTCYYPMIIIVGAREKRSSQGNAL